MNHTFRTLWNAVRGQLVPVSEVTSSHSQTGDGKRSGSKTSRPRSTLRQVTRLSALNLAVASAMAASGFLPLTASAAYEPDDLHKNMSIYLTIGHEDFSDVRSLEVLLRGENRPDDYWVFDADKLNAAIDAGWEGYSFIGPYLGAYVLVEGSEVKPQLPTTYVIGQAKNESAGFTQINGSFGTSHINAEEVHVNSGKTLTFLGNRPLLPVTCKPGEECGKPAATVPEDNTFISVDGDASSKGKLVLSEGSSLQIGFSHTLAAGDLPLPNDGLLPLVPGSLEVPFDSAPSTGYSSTPTLGSIGTIIAKDQSTVTIARGTLEVLDDFEVEAGSTLTVFSDGKFIADLTNFNGSLRANGALEGDQSAWGNLDATYDAPSYDLSGAVTKHTDATVAAGTTIRNNSSIVIDGETFKNGYFQAAGTLTNHGTLVDDGTGVWKVQNLANETDGTVNIGTLNALSVVGFPEFPSNIVNKGRAFISKLSSERDQPLLNPDEWFDVVVDNQIDATLHVGELDASSALFKLQNASSTTVDAVNGSYLALDNKSGTLTLKGDVLVGYGLDNEDGATIAFEDGKASISNLSLDSLLNDNNGKIVADSIDFVGQGYGFHLTSTKGTGVIEANSILVESWESTILSGNAVYANQLTNYGYLTAREIEMVGENAVFRNERGVMAAANIDGSLSTLKINGTFVNGEEIATGALLAGKTIINGTFVNGTDLPSVIPEYSWVNDHYEGSGTFLGDADLQSGQILQAYDGTAFGVHSLTVAAGTSVQQDGVVITDAGFDFDGDRLVRNSGEILVNNLAIDGDTSVVNEAGARIEVASFDTLSGRYLIENAGQMSAVDQRDTLVDAVYTQTGNGNLTIDHGKWFANSTLNIFGGRVDRGEYGLGENNVYNIKNEGFAGVGSSPSLGADWSDGASVVTTDRLTSSNIVNLQAGGVLETPEITLDAGGKTLNFQGGALVTGLDQIFKGVEFEGLLLEAIDESGRVTVTSDNLAIGGATTVAGFADGIEEHVDFGSGDIVFTDEYVSVGILGSINETLQSIGADDITVHFTGRMDKVFTVDTANELLADQASGAQAGVVFDNSTLYARTDDDPTGKPLVVGGEAPEGSLAIYAQPSSSIGFKNVEGTDSVTIVGGAEFALVGESGESLSLVGTSENGSVAVEGENSTLTLGSLGLKNTMGSLKQVALSDDGRLLVKNGSYDVAEVSGKAGKVEILGGGVLKATATLYDGSNFENEGRFEGSLHLTDSEGVNGNVINAEVLNVDGTASFTNEGDLVAQSFTQSDDSTYQQASGATTITDFTLTGGLFKITGGTLSATDLTTLDGGQLVLAGAEKQVDATLKINDEINSEIAVDNAVLSIAKYQGEDHEALTYPDAEAILVGDNLPITLGSTGKIAVGEGAQSHLASMSGSSAWFGSDSLFVVDTAQLTPIEGGGSGALVGSGDFATETGAKLHFANFGYGRYYITYGFANELLADGSWQDNVTFDPDEHKDLYVDQDEDGNVILTVTQKDPSNPGEGGDDDGDDDDDKPEIHFPETAIPDNVQEIIEDPDKRDPDAGGAPGFINQVVEPSYLDPDDMVEVINTVSQIAAAGGELVEAMTLAGNVSDIAERHLQFEDVHFKNGNLQRWDSVRLWADALGQKLDASGYKYTLETADFDGENYGFILGADLITDNNFRWGAAFAAQRGNLDSKNDVVSTSNDSEAYSVVLYGAKDFGKVNVIGTFAWTHVESELKQTLPATMKLREHTLDASNDIFTLGLKTEYRHPISKTAAVVPYVGVRGIMLKTADDDSKIDGKKAFGYETDTAYQVQIPVGVQLQAYRETESGWTTRGLFDASVTAAFGDKDTDTDIFGYGIGELDTVNTEFSDDVIGMVRVGFSAEKTDWMFGGTLSLSTGGNRDAGITFGLNARYRF